MTVIEERRPGRLTRLADSGATVTVRFDPNVEGQTRRPPELIDVSHPLVLWIKAEVGARRSDVVPALAIELAASGPGSRTDSIFLLRTFGAWKASESW